MKKRGVWAINICQINGIPVAVHNTFFLLLLWVASQEVHAGRAPLGEVVFVLCLFVCVVLHELGHALTAGLFGIKTRDIVLYPFGGIATVLGEAAPRAEFFIAAAGPVVSLLTAAVLFPLSGLLDANFALSGPMNLSARLVLANLALAIFNLLPAFPMDGGRILRAALALLRVPYATGIALRLSQIITLLLAATALYFGFILLFIVAAFVFLSAWREYRQMKIAPGYAIAAPSLPAAPKQEP